MRIFADSESLAHFGLGAWAAMSIRNRDVIVISFVIYQIQEHKPIRESLPDFLEFLVGYLSAGLLVRSFV